MSRPGGPTAASATPALPGNGGRDLGPRLSVSDQLFADRPARAGFRKGRYATVGLAYCGDPLRIPIGLDGVYRIGPHGPFGLPAGATGTWRSDTEFLLDVNFIANINHYTLAIKFLPDRTIDVSADEASGLLRNGKLVGTPR